MCGIAGYTHRDHRPDPERIRSATVALLHRGPDQQGLYEDEAVSLGAVRLRIIDPGGGEQPMVSEDGDLVIVFNGEVYNHAALRDELERRGHRFRSRCDTEVVLRSFLEWDTECLSRLRGMFGVALWRKSERRLLLARDRVGIKPLYYLRRGRDILFGSELKAILAHPEVERRIDLEGLDYYLSLNYVPCPHTLIQGIRKLPPGCWLDWRDGELRGGRYWKLCLRPDPNWTLETAKQELDGLLKAAVREHLVSDVPLGIWASGGVDSTTILHYAAEASASRLKTFSVSFPGQGCDESPYFREVAARYGTDHHQFDLVPEAGLAGAIEKIAWHSDEPSADAGALPVYFLAQLSKRHVTVALSGEGADELFGGYYTYLADRYGGAARMAPPGARRLALRLLRRWPVSDAKIGLEYKLKRFLAGSLLDPLEAHFFWNGAFFGAEKSALLQVGEKSSLAGLFDSIRGEAEASGPLNRFLWLDQLYYLPDDILYKCDRMSMAHALEVRPPFLDHRIVEFSATLPESLKIRGSRLKHVLKELIRDKVPARVVRRRKEGFDIPAHAWFRGPLRPLLLDTLTRDAVRASGLFSWPVVETLIGDHLGRRANLGYHLWGLMTLFLWMRKWNVQTRQAAEECLVPSAAIN